MDKQRFVLANHNVRDKAAWAVKSAPEGWVCTLEEPKRSGDQNGFFHALCSDIARSKYAWAGKPRTAEQWKILLVSGHSIATGEGADMIPGLENEFVNLRESTARMRKSRASSLIEYVLAFCHTNGIPVTDKRDYGFGE